MEMITLQINRSTCTPQKYCDCLYLQRLKYLIFHLVCPPMYLTESLKKLNENDIGWIFLIKWDLPRLQYKWNH